VHLFALGFFYEIMYGDISKQQNLKHCRLESGVAIYLPTNHYKMKNQLLILFCFISLISYSQFPADIYLEELATGFLEPTEIVNAGDDRLFVCEKKGIIKIIDGDGKVLEDPFLDIREKVRDWQEGGLIGIVFHPDYQSNGWFYINYTTLDGYDRIARYSVSMGNPDRADHGSEREIILIQEEFPTDFHHGGSLHFGPDGYLYIAVGDGGFWSIAQDLNSLWGTILRLDIDNGNPYTIPSDNPYVGSTYREEIWASGVRNPWKISFDAKNGDLWISDVGEKDREEVSRITSDMDYGQNLGWPCFEGTYNLGGFGCEELDSSELLFPTAEIYFDKDVGYCGGSITGGYVYRGQTESIETLDAYIFSDFCNGKIYTTYPVNGIYETIELYDNPAVLGNVSTLGQDINGELLIADYVEGKIFRLDFNCKFPEIDITVASCKMSKDGCIEITIPQNQGILDYVILDSLGQTIPVSDYCQIGAGNYTMSVTNTDSQCSKEVPFNVVTFEPIFRTGRRSCDVIDDGCVEVVIRQNVSEDLDFRIEDDEGMTIDSSEYCQLSGGYHYLILEDDALNCQDTFDFFISTNYEFFGLSVIDNILYAPSEYVSFQWFYSEPTLPLLNYEEIPGAIYESHVPEDVGYYRCWAVGEDGCTDRSFSQEIEMVSSTSGLGEKSAYKIYPNPVSEYLTIDLKNSEIERFEISILDVSGRRIYNYSDQLKISTEMLEPGVYFLTITDGEKQTAQRFIKL